MKDVLPTVGRRAGYVISTRQMKMILEMPKAENHIHIEGSILPRTLIRLAKRNGVELPVRDEYQFVQHIMRNVRNLNAFMASNRLFNSVCIYSQDYEEVLFDLALDAKSQNILYQEYHLDYPINEVRGISFDVVMDGYLRARDRALDELGVDIVLLGGIDRTLGPDKANQFVDSFDQYPGEIEGLGMDCEEIGNPCRVYVESYQKAKKMGLFLTAHAGEDSGVKNGDQEIWDALNILGAQRIDHGCQAIKDPILMEHLANQKIMLTICPSANIGSNNVTSYHEHPVREYFLKGIPCSINSDNPSISGDLVQQYARAISLIGFEDSELIEMARNAFTYSIRGQKYLPIFESWVEEWNWRVENESE